MDTSYKLIYFPVKAIAEPIRFLLSYGGIKFEDERVDLEKWKMMKNDTPFGQLPLFYINDTIAYQSIAICRYLGNIVKLAGDNELENLEIDMIVDTIAELRSRIAVYNKEDNNSPKKSKLHDEIMNEHLPFYLERINKTAQNGHLALNKLTWADLYFVSILDYCNGVLKTNIIEKYSNLCELRDEVLNIPAIKEWVENRPDSEY